MPTSENYGSGVTPRTGDTRRIVWTKILLGKRVEKNTSLFAPGKADGVRRIKEKILRTINL